MGSVDQGTWSGRRGPRASARVPHMAPAYAFPRILTEGFGDSRVRLRRRGPGEDSTGRAPVARRFCDTPWGYPRGPTRGGRDGALGTRLGTGRPARGARHAAGHGASGTGRARDVRPGPPDPWPLPACLLWTQASSPATTLTGRSGQIVARPAKNRPPEPIYCSRGTNLRDPRALAGRGRRYLHREQREGGGLLGAQGIGSLGRQCPVLGRQCPVRALPAQGTSVRLTPPGAGPIIRRTTTRPALSGARRVCVPLGVSDRPSPRPDGEDPEHPR
jgi:hypothetical protein